MGEFRANTCEGTNGVTVTTANTAGPDQFSDAATSGAGAACVFDTAQSHTGTSSIRLDFPAGVAATSYVRWTGLVSDARKYALFYFRMTANPSVGLRIAQFTGGGGALRCSLVLNAAGTLRLNDNAGGQLAVTTATVPLSAWCRIEYEITGVSGTTGTVSARLYSGANLEGPTPDAGGIASASGTVGGNADAVVYGNFAGVTETVAWSAWLDDVSENNGTPPAAGFAKPGKTWLRRFHHRQTPQAVTADAVTLIAFDETGSGADTLAVTAAAALAESGSAADTLTVTAATPLAESGTGTDTLSVAAGGTPALAETGTAADTLTVTATVPLADSGTGTDTFLGVRQVAQAETGTGSDTLAVAAAVPLAEAGSSAQTLTVLAALALADAAAALDTLSVSVLLPFTVGALTASAAPTATQAPADKATNTLGAVLAPSGAITASTAAGTLTASDTASAAEEFTPLQAENLTEITDEAGGQLA